MTAERERCMAKEDNKYKTSKHFLKDAHKYYKEYLKTLKADEGRPVAYDLFRRINSMYGSLLQDYVLMGREVGLPAGIGTIIATKYDRKNRFTYVRAYSPGGGISEDKTVMLDRYGYEIRFRRNGSICRPVTGFKFIPGWVFKDRLRRVIKDGYGGRFTYLKSKTLHRNEI